MSLKKAAAVADSLDQLPELRQRMRTAADSAAAASRHYEAGRRADSLAIGRYRQAAWLYERSFDKQGELTQAARSDALANARGRRGWRIAALVLGGLFLGSVFTH